MSDILDEAQGVLQCKTCHWYKNCVMPMRVTEEDLKKQMESSMPGMAPQDPSQNNMSQLFSQMASALQNSLLEGCPVFIERLRTNPRLAQKVKMLMQNWTEESEA